jgi:hypothetical protein
LCTNQEYHPFLFAQHQSLPFATYGSFNEAVDEFYSNLESQKYDVKCMQQVSFDICKYSWYYVEIILK